MRMKRLVSCLLATSLLAVSLGAFSGCGDTSANGGNKDGKFTVGICQLAPHEALDAATLGFREQLEKELGADKVEFLEQNAQGEPTVCTTIINDFTTKNVDLIMANATAALQAAAEGTDTIPVLGTSITEYGTALSIKDFSGTIGGNVSGTSDLAPLDQQAKMVKELFPNAKTVALMYCSGEANSDYQIKVVKQELEALNFTCELFPFTDSNDVATVATAAAAKDVIYIPTDNKAAECAGAIYGAIGDTPVFAGEENLCAGCGVATLSISYYDLGVATAKMAAKILKGEANISEMPIEYSATFAKKYNASRCQEINMDVEALKDVGYVAIDTVR